jgi:hypothetical protein
MRPEVVARLCPRPFLGGVRKPSPSAPCPSAGSGRGRARWCPCCGCGRPIRDRALKAGDRHEPGHPRHLRVPQAPAITKHHGERDITARKVLYFPYISVPESAWFTRVLLYWDEVGSIVPSPYEADLARLTPYMSELVRAELVRPIVPERYDRHLHRAVRPFLEFIDSDPLITDRARRRLGSAPAPRSGLRPVP